MLLAQFQRDSEFDEETETYVAIPATVTQEGEKIDEDWETEVATDLWKIQGEAESECSSEHNNDQSEEADRSEPESVSDILRYNEFGYRHLTYQE